MKYKRTETCLKHPEKSLFVRRFISTLILLVLFLACGCLVKKPIAYNELTMKVIRGGYPKSMAVLPFKNTTSEEQIDELVRISFYSHFSVRPYRDIELLKIDKEINNHDKIDYSKISNSYVRKWGQILKCDALIVGEVIQFRRLFLGVYSQIKLAVHIAIWDTRTGNKIWDDHHVVRSHEGGVPFHLAEVPLIVIKSGLNLLEKEKVKVTDELCRYLTQRIPAPVEVINDQDSETKYTFELQVGAFIDEQRADTLLDELREKGYPAFIQRKEKENGWWSRVLLGPYEIRQEAIETQRKIQKDLSVNSFVVHKIPDAQVD